MAVVAIWLAREYSAERGPGTVFLVEKVAKVRHDTFSTKVRWASDNHGYDILCGSKRKTFAQGKTYIVAGQMREAWGEDKCLEVLAAEERGPLPEVGLDTNAGLVILGRFEPSSSASPQSTRSSGETDLSLDSPLFSKAANPTSLMESVKGKYGESLQLTLCGKVELSGEPADVKVSLVTEDRKRGCYEWSQIIVSPPQRVYVKGGLGDF